MSTNNIKFIYNTNQLSSSGGSSAYMVIFIFIFIIGYFYYKLILKDISYDWDHKRCTPKYIFYSGFFKSPTGDPFKDTYTNFVQCTDPTKTNSNGVNKFKVVFDTANTITNTANSIINYSNDIMKESDRIKGESVNRLSSVKEKTNVINTTMNQLYNYQLKLYTILKMYFERIFLVLDTLATYTTDITLFSLSNLKNGLSYKGEQLTPFIYSRIQQYKNIYNGDITTAASKLKSIKDSTGDKYDNADYDEVLKYTSSAKDKYTELINALIAFDRENRTKLLEIDTRCKELTDHNIKYTSIFPFLKNKILNPSEFKTDDIV
jgi:hypothetical protein